MPTAEEKTIFGATVLEPGLSRPTPPHLDSTYSQVSAISDVSVPTSPMTPTNIAFEPSNPYSASQDPLHPAVDNRASSKTYLDVYASDVESGSPMSTTTTIQPKHSVDCRLKESKQMTMWPSKQSLIAEHKAGKRQRRCGGKDPLRNLNKKQKIAVKTIIALLVIAMAVGLGVGISRAVGGGVWAGSHSTVTIPNENGQ